MGEVNEIEFSRVIQLPPPARYQYFIKRVVDERRAWGLMVRDALILWTDRGEDPVLPLWPDVRFALHCSRPPAAPSPLRVPWSLQGVLAIGTPIPARLSIFPTQDTPQLVLPRTVVEEAIRARMRQLGLLHQDEPVGSLGARVRQQRARRAAPELRLMLNEALGVTVDEVQVLSIDDTDRLRHMFTRRVYDDSNFYRFTWRTEEGPLLWTTLFRASDVLPAVDVVLLPSESDAWPGVLVPAKSVFSHAPALFVALGENDLRLWMPGADAGLNLDYSVEQWDEEFTILASGVFAAALIAAKGI